VERVERSGTSSALDVVWRVRDLERGVEDRRGA
jgi:hypothetical protein